MYQLTNEEILLALHRETVLRFFHALSRIPGSRRITAQVKNGRHDHIEHFVLSRDGHMKPGEKAVLQMTLSVGLDNGGVVIVRQNLREKKWKEGEPSERMWGWVLGDGGYVSLTDTELSGQVAAQTPDGVGVEFGNAQALEPASPAS